MNSPDEHDNGDLDPGAEGRIRAAVEEFLGRLEAGEEPDLQSWLAGRRDIAPELGRRLRAALLLRGIAQRPGADGDPERLPTNVAAVQGVPPEPAFAAVLGDRYRIEGPLGEGSSACVYRAHDAVLKRQVALKVVHLDQMGRPGGEARFARDARIVARLFHPNIVPVHDAGEVRGVCFIALELIEGQSLEQSLRRQEGFPMESRAAAGLVRTVAAALGYAHRCGVVHRDVKPANILLDARGVPWLTDFGLARCAAESPTLTRQGDPLGTPAYMSPEQADGRSHEADGRTDIYGLGVILYHLLTGRLPYEEAGSLSELLGRIVRDDPPRPRSLVPAIPEDLELICLKAMEKAPDDRFADADAFADELGRWLAGEPLLIRGPTTAERLLRWARRHRSAATAVMVSLALLLACLVLGILALTYRHRERLLGHAHAEVRALTLIGQANQRLDQPAPGRRRDALRDLREAAALRERLGDTPEADRLGLEIRSTLAASLGVPDLAVEKASLPYHPLEPWPVALHPDGRSLVIGTGTGPVRWRRGRPPAIPEGLDPMTPRGRPTYSPGGRYLILAHDEGRLELWDGDLTRLLASREGSEPSPVLAVGFDRRETTVRTFQADGRLRTLSLPTLEVREARAIIPEDSSEWTSAAFGVGASRLVVGTADGRLLIDAGERSRHVLDVSRSAITTLACSTDDTLAVGTRDGELQVRTADGRDVRHRYTDFWADIPSIRFSPDGRYLLAGRAATCKIWDLTTGDEFLEARAGVPGNLSRDGRVIALSSNNFVAFADLAAPRIIRQVRGHDAIVMKLDWSRDNRRLVTLDANFEVRVWDVERAQLLDHFAGPPGDFYARHAAVALSDDGRQVAYASGGERQSVALIRDVDTGRTLDRWELPGAFELMTHAEGRFLLVREEFLRDGEFARTRTVARPLVVGGSPEIVSIVRPPGPEDRRRFLSHRLTRDGRTYLWVGPRLPQQRRRIEIRAVATGELLARVPQPTEANFETSAVLDDNGGLYYQGEDGQWNWHRDPDGHIRTLPFLPLAVSPDGRWFTADSLLDRLGLPDVADLALWDREGGRAYLELDGPGEFPLAQRFSPDGRYLAWGGRQDGAVIVADLEALRRQLQEFEATVPRE